MVGTIGLTASAPAAYYVITGNFNATTWILWLANILFAGDQIHYVQLRIHTAKVEGFRAKLARGWAFAVGQALMTAIITLLHGSPDASGCFDRICAASLPRMVLLCSGAHASDRASTGVE